MPRSTSPNSKPSFHIILLKVNCPHCPKLFTRRSDLTRHVTTVHEKRRDFHCDWPGCGKSFGQKAGLAAHVPTQGLKPHTCPHCQRQFGDPAAKSRHMREKHADPLNCPVDGCEQTYTRRGRLLDHLRKFHPDVQIEANLMEMATPASRQRALISRESARSRKHGDPHDPAQVVSSAGSDLEPASYTGWLYPDQELIQMETDLKTRLEYPQGSHPDFKPPFLAIDKALTHSDGAESIPTEQAAIQATYLQVPSPDGTLVGSSSQSPQPASACLPSPLPSTLTESCAWSFLLESPGAPCQGQPSGAGSHTSQSLRQLDPAYRINQQSCQDFDHLNNLAALMSSCHAPSINYQTALSPAGQDSLSTLPLFQPSISMLPLHSDDIIDSRPDSQPSLDSLFAYHSSGLPSGIAQIQQHQQPVIYQPLPFGTYGTGLARTDTISTFDWNFFKTDPTLTQQQGIFHWDQL